ncbi:mitochondrial [2Fe-2S] cluster assembly frataxin Fxn1 [Schizosaccharomyces osmophilus]|uniref:ferroxidase n=1 Tax=Schizosaccharomyces osmophilus TaxID=2545709 RepID=A0AAE9WHB8_9SCHI|nr:mitochondrial [2Fe-2S] cluster assembly frataxin Fxn1 [Schizosaccharomyces osmophilus]WBW75012.1 mitochondrial [2Fe-2S] cluster assembly frataxin Fxn1 [Schizosaccharomyces osmophilus]
MQSLRGILFQKAFLNSQRLFYRPPTGWNPCLRFLSTVNPTKPLSDLEYHRIADDTLEVFNNTFEDLLEESGRRDYDIEYSSGVLTLNLGDHGTYVINKQPPAHQVWLSSPLSGPKHYEWSSNKKAWKSTRDDSTMCDILAKEIGNAFSKNIEFKHADDY